MTTYRDDHTHTDEPGESNNRAVPAPAGDPAASDAPPHDEPPAAAATPTGDPAPPDASTHDEPAKPAKPTKSEKHGRA